MQRDIFLNRFVRRLEGQRSEVASSRAHVFMHMGEDLRPRPRPMKDVRTNATRRTASPARRSARGTPFPIQAPTFLLLSPLRLTLQNTHALSSSSGACSTSRSSTSTPSCRPMVPAPSAIILSNPSSSFGRAHPAPLAFSSFMRPPPGRSSTITSEGLITRYR